MLAGPLSQCTAVDSPLRFVQQGWAGPEAVVIANGCLVSNNRESLWVHSLGGEGKLLFETTGGQSFPIPSFFHPEENVKLAVVRLSQGTYKLVKFRIDAEARGEPLNDWSVESHPIYLPLRE